VQIEQHRIPDGATLILATIGFSREQDDVVQQLPGNQVHSGVRRRMGSLAEADACWASGARTQLLTDGSLRIGPGEPGGRSVRLAVEDVQRPIAFSGPFTSRDSFTFVGSITSSPHRARQAWVAGAPPRPRNGESLWSPGGQGSGLGAEAAATRTDFTVPASLVQASSPI
jgi:hypothetical protein